MIRSLHLQNFKSFREATVPLGRFTLLVGTNASGKSNVREALRFLHAVFRGYSLMEVLGEKFGPGGELQWDGIRGGPEEVAFRGAESYSLSVTVKHVLEESKYTITVGPKDVFEIVEGDRIPVFCSGPREDGSASGFAKPSGRNATSETPFASVDAVSTTLAGLRSLDLVSEALPRASFPGTAELTSRGENLATVIHRICADAEKKAALISWLHELTPSDVVDFEFPKELSGRIVLRLVERNGTKLTAFSASDGTLRFLALAAALIDAHDTLFFIEEIDTGIHPSRLHLLVQLIEAQCAANNNQVVATTHAPWMLSWLSKESRDSALVVYRCAEDGSSKVRRIMDLPDIQRILETTDPSTLHAEGWLESAVAFADEQDAGA